MRERQGTTSSTFKDANQEIEEFLWDPDQTAKVGIKYASIFMLMAEPLIGQHQQLPEDEHQVPIKDVGQFLTLVGLLAILTCDQFARVLVKSIAPRRGNVAAIH